MAEIRKKSSSLSGEIWRRFKRNKVAMVSLCFLVVLFLVAIFSDLLVSYDTTIKQNIMQRLQGPSREHWFGTDDFGRDVFARIIHGARISLIIGIVTTMFSMTAAVILGSIAGYFGGKIENMIMRINDTLMCIPGSLLIISIVASLGVNVKNLIIAMAIGRIPPFIRIVRSIVLNLAGNDFIEAARANGGSNTYIIIKHIIPNAIGPIIVQATMNISTAIISAASFSYIGLGVQPPQAEWGIMLSEAKNFLRTNSLLSIIPGLAITFTALSFNLVGDGLRDSLDPRLKD